MARAANALLRAFQGATTLTVKKIAQDEAFMKATFDGEKSALVQCVRFMMEQGVVALVEEGALTEESVFVLKDGKEDKRNQKEFFHGLQILSLYATGMTGQIYAEAGCRTNFICSAEAQQYMWTRSGQIHVRSREQCK